MRDGTARLIGFLGLSALFLLAAPRIFPAEISPAGMFGLGFEYFSRTIRWEDGARASTLKGNLVTARGMIGLKPGVTLDLAAGVSLADFNGLLFNHLPISLDYEAGALSGLLLAAGVRARLFSFGDFEMEGRGWFVYSLGFSRTWPLQGFAVEGNSRGRPVWLEAAAGPRIIYRLSRRIRSFLSVSANWLWGTFRMDETLGDLSGTEEIKVRGRGVLEAALGVDAAISARLSLCAEVGLLPSSGGVDGRAGIGLLFIF
jgi:hypothetical protein